MLMRLACLNKVILSIYLSIYVSKFRNGTSSKWVLVLTYALSNFSLYVCICMCNACVYVCIWAVLQISYHGISIEKYRGITVIPFTNYRPMQNPRWYKIVTMLTLSNNKHIIRFYEFWFTMYVKLDRFARWYLSAW